MKSRSLLCALLLLFTAHRATAQNQVLDLDGRTAYVQLPAHLFDTLHEATVEAWVKWEDWASFSQWFAFGTDGQWKTMGINHADTTATLQFLFYTGAERIVGQPKLHLVRLGTDLPLGQWCHLAAVSGPGGMRFYLNGVLLGQNGYEGSFAAIAPGENNYLGRSSWKENAFFRGQLDEVRVLAATNSDLQTQIRAGAFRQDLYYRLAPFTVQVPSLRERREDIGLLTRHFLQVFALEMGILSPAISPEAVALLEQYDFPGNIRELKNIVERALIESRRQEIRPEHLHLPMATAADGAQVAEVLPLNLEQAELLLIQRAMAQSGGNVSEAARLLGIERTKLYRHLGRIEKLTPLADPT